MARVLSWVGFFSWRRDLMLKMLSLKEPRLCSAQRIVDILRELVLGLYCFPLISVLRIIFEWSFQEF